MLNLEDIQSKDSNLLGVKVKNFGECGFCSDEESREVLKIPWNIWSQWLYVSQYMSNKEWGAVFWVKEDAITEFKLPKQRVSSTECEFEEDLGGDGIVHSHHDMGAFHSSQDDHHARNLYEYSIVISNSRGYSATRRKKLPCNGFGYVRVELHLIGCPEIDLSKIAEKAIPSSISREDAQKQLDFKADKLPCDRCTTQDCQNCAHFYTGEFPCGNCISFKCKDCQQTRGLDISEVLPFCDFCEDVGSCANCDKLAKYLKNYPQDRLHFEYLYKHSAFSE
jgi:hypothetical protein